MGRKRTVTDPYSVGVKGIKAAAGKAAKTKTGAAIQEEVAAASRALRERAAKAVPAKVKKEAARLTEAVHRTAEKVPEEGKLLAKELAKTAKDAGRGLGATERAVQRHNAPMRKSEE